MNLNLIHTRAILTFTKELKELKYFLNECSNLLCITHKNYMAPKWFQKMLFYKKLKVNWVHRRPQPENQESFRRWPRKPNSSWQHFIRISGNWAYQNLKNIIKVCVNRNHPMPPISCSIHTHVFFHFSSF